jgi:hypothetical protein
MPAFGYPIIVLVKLKKKTHKNFIAKVCVDNYNSNTPA